MPKAKRISAAGLLAVLVFLAAALPPAAAMDCIEGSGVAREETRPVAPFTELAVDGVFAVRVLVGPSQQVAIRGDDNILPYIRTTVRNGRLSVSSDRSLCIRTDLRLEIHVPSLTAFASNGTVDLTVTGIHGPRFSLTLGGSGAAALSGRCERFEALLAGAGDLEAGELEAGQVSVRLTGAGDASVFAAERLEAAITGMGTITYAGEPDEIHQDISGLGDVVPR